VPAGHQVSTPVNWRQGEEAIISTAVSDAEAEKKYPAGWKAPRPYLRIVACQWYRPVAHM
jgi:hypothetical protein